MIAIVDYGAGNLTSVRLAFEAMGVLPVVTRDPNVIRAADRVVFPGVGAARQAMENLCAFGLAEPVREAAATKPFLGICLGMQILFSHSEEDGGVDTLDVFHGRVRRFPDVAGCKVPAIGWNEVRLDRPLASGLRDPVFYFVHSYCAELVPETAGVSGYAGIEFTALVKRGSLWASQFHPEKSGRVGLGFLKEWLSC